MGVIYVNRNDARAGARTTRALMHKLQAGEPLAIFAEGTFKPEPGLLPFKVGAFLIAARCGVPIVPAAIRGSRRLYGGGRRLPRRSEEHTSELQSLMRISYAVFCLKKKNTKIHHNNVTSIKHN